MSRRNWRRGRWRGRNLRHPSLDPWHHENWTEGQARNWSSEAQSRRAQSHWGRKGTRFWARVEKTRRCWIWRGPVARSGYGLYHGNGEAFAHRYAFSVVVGPIPRGLVVMHDRCDNRLCCRPSHLKLGTQKENLARASALGRMRGGAKDPRRGEEVNFAKICTAQAQTALDFWAAGRTQAEIARLTGIRRENVWCIVHRKSWRHLQPEAGSR